MIAIIRITGDVKIRQDVRETFQRLGLTRKYSCIVLENAKPDEMGMLNKLKDVVAYGELDKETFKKLVEARGYKPKAGTKISKDKQEKPRRQVFRLHPPRGGIDSKLYFGQKKGVLGNHEDKINKLVERML